MKVHRQLSARARALFQQYPVVTIVGPKVGCRKNRQHLELFLPGPGCRNQTLHRPRMDDTASGKLYGVFITSMVCQCKQTLDQIAETLFLRCGSCRSSIEYRNSKACVFPPVERRALREPCGDRVLKTSLQHGKAKQSEFLSGQ